MKRSFVVKVVGWCRCEGSLVVVENFSAISRHFYLSTNGHEFSLMFWIPAFAGMTVSTSLLVLPGRGSRLRGKDGGVSSGNFSAIFGHFPPFLFIHEWTRMFTNVVDSGLGRSDGWHRLAGLFRSRFPPTREGRGWWWRNFFRHFRPFPAIFVGLPFHLLAGLFLSRGNPSTGSG